MAGPHARTLQIQEKVRHFLSQDLPRKEIAAALGISISRIHQLVREIKGKEPANPQPVSSQCPNNGQDQWKKDLLGIVNSSPEDIKLPEIMSLLDVMAGISTFLGQIPDKNFGEPGSVYASLIGDAVVRRLIATTFALNKVCTKAATLKMKSPAPPSPSD